METMVTLAIISVVSSVVFPAIDNFRSGNRVQAVASIIINDIRMGRYKAIEDQIVHRLVFQISDNELVSYKIETFTGFDEDGNGTADFDGTNDATLEEDYDNSSWESILSEEEVYFDSSVELKRKWLPQCIYFWPNGQLVIRKEKDKIISDSNILPIPECYLTFGYGNAGIRTVINAYGVFASEAYQPDEDEDIDKPESDAIW